MVERRLPKPNVAGSNPVFRCRKALVFFGAFIFIGKHVNGVMTHNGQTKFTRKNMGCYSRCMCLVYVNKQEQKNGRSMVVTSFFLFMWRFVVKRRIVYESV